MDDSTVIEGAAMGVEGPVIIGGNGHSGTRVFTEIVTLGGVFTGIGYLTKRRQSEDLRIFDLLNQWVGAYVNGSLAAGEKAKMKQAFTRRLRLYFPFRGRRWGFKNPRTLLILPFLNELLPGMRFIHVIRDGRDIALGNPFVTNNRYIDAFLSDGEKSLSPEEKMILFWGRSNQRAMEYGTTQMQDRYLMMRWEDLCTDAMTRSAELLRFVSGPLADAEVAARLVMRPKSMGRWRTFPAETVQRVVARGDQWLKLFGYA